MGNHLGVGLGGERVPVGHQLGAQLQEVLDDSIVNQRHAIADMGMGIDLVGHAVRGPAGVADAGEPAQRLRLQALGQPVELTRCATPLDPPRNQCGDPGAVVAAILEPPQRIEQQGCCRPPADYPDDPAHGRSAPPS